MFLEVRSVLKVLLTVRTLENCEAAGQYPIFYLSEVIQYLSLSSKSNKLDERTLLNQEFPCTLFPVPNKDTGNHPIINIYVEMILKMLALWFFFIWTLKGL